MFHLNILTWYVWKEKGSIDSNHQLVCCTVRLHITVKSVLAKNVIYKKHNGKKWPLHVLCIKMNKHTHSPLPDNDSQKLVSNNLSQCFPSTDLIIILHQDEPACVIRWLIGDTNNEHENRLIWLHWLTSWHDWSLYWFFIIYFYERPCSETSIASNRSPQFLICGFEALCAYCSTSTHIICQRVVLHGLDSLILQLACSTLVSRYSLLKQNLTLCQDQAMQKVWFVCCC